MPIRQSTFPFSFPFYWLLLNMSILIYMPTYSDNIKNFLLTTQFFVRCQRCTGEVPLLCTGYVPPSYRGNHKNSQLIMNWPKLCLFDKTVLHRILFVLNGTEYFFRLGSDLHQRQRSTSLLPLQVAL